MQEQTGREDLSTAGTALRASSVTLVEVVLDSHRVTGEVRYSGPPRRLVDILNAADGPFLLLYNVTLEDPSRPEDERRRFPVIHIHRAAILFAMPRDSNVAPASTFELVEKVPVPATVVLPAFELAGTVYLVPDVDPTVAPFLASGRFVPMTDVVVTASHNHGGVRREPLVVVNLERAQMYAPGLSSP